MLIQLFLSINLKNAFIFHYVKFQNSNPQPRQISWYVDLLGIIPESNLDEIWSIIGIGLVKIHQLF